MKFGNVNISNQVSVNVTRFRNDLWFHIKRKGKSVSLPKGDFEALLKKKAEIKKVADKMSHTLTRYPKKSGKKRKHKEVETDSSYSEDSFTDSDSD